MYDYWGLAEVGIWELAAEWELPETGIKRALLSHAKVGQDLEQGCRSCGTKMIPS